jgi:hypothetical protein
MILVGQQGVHDPEVALLGYSGTMRKGEDGEIRCGDLRERSAGSRRTARGFLDREGAFQPGAFSIQVLVQMNFRDAVVIEIDRLANGILRNFKPSIQIPPQGRLEVEPERKAEGMGFQLL